MDFLIGFIVAVLSGMGVGGGGLLVIYLSVWGDTKQLEAQGINLVFFICSALSAMLYHAFHRKLRWRVIAVCSAAGIVGTVGGSFAAAAAGGNLRPIFGGFLIFCGTLSLIKGWGKKKHKKIND